MNGRECKFVKYMEGSDKRFVIPVYQRNYDWKTDNCKQLYDDLIRIIREKRKSHFFGSLVSVYNPDGSNEEFLVIDGQQRLTTVSLLFLAMYNLIEQGRIVPENATLKRRIYEKYLVDEYQLDDTRIKLKPVKNDQRAFEKLFKESDEYVKESNITINYNYFYERIQKQEISIDELYEAICSLEIINIKLNNEDNPQLIFESLNSTGLDLSEGDKIRNFILMGLPTKDQNLYYDKYWNPIEEATGYDVSSFVRDYLSVKQLAIPSQKKVYMSFKDYVRSSSIDTEDLLSDLLAYAKRYHILIKGSKQSKPLNACIDRLNRLETTVTRPFFMEVLRLYDESKLSLSDTTEIFIVTENYLLRRSICDLPTNVLNKIFLLLHREIYRYENNTDNYLAKFKYTLMSKKEKARFPDDEEFVDAFSTRQIYQMYSKNKIYILERFENFGTSEDKDVYRHCDEGEYTIEHIMPQHLTQSWIKSLGEDYEQIHETWIHRMANLTLTAYNSKYSNNSFDDKKNMKNGFADSGIRMNTYIAQKSKWTLVELVDRNDYLMNRALTIWPYPVTDFKPREKVLDTCTLEDDPSEFTGRTISKFVFRSAEQPVSSWVDMYVNVLKTLYSENKNIITKLAVSTDDDIDSHVSFTKDDFKSCEEIGDGIYVLTHTNTQSKINNLIKIFKMYDIDPSELVFALRESNDKYDDESGTRYELRRKYWTYALDDIKEENKSNESFAKVNTSKENWISGCIGVSGIYIICVANYDEARVELYIGKSSKEDNKKIYDMLLTHKDEIERNLNISLTWSRGDDIKSSKITCKLENISIENETDWKQMSKFHAKWSRRFFEIFVPYLRNNFK